MTNFFLFALLVLTPLASAKLGFGFEDYKTMMRGFLLGLTVDEKHLDHLLSCLTDRKTLEVRFVETMDKIDKLDFTNLPLTAELFVELYDVVTVSIVEIDLCAKDNEEYDRLFRKIYHLMQTTIIKRLMLNFISNGQQTFKDIQDAIDNYLLGKYKQLGNDLGDLMHMVLIYRVSNEGMTLDEYVKLVKGLLKGLNVNNDVEKVLKCVEKVPDVVAIIEMALETIKKFDIKNIGEIVQAFVKIFDAVKKLLSDLSVCAETVTELKAIIEKLSNLDVKKILTYVMGNFMQLIADVVGAKSAWEAKDFEAFGTHIGNIVYRVLLAPKDA